MAQDVTTLTIKTEAKGVPKATDQLNKLEKQGVKTEKTIGSLAVASAKLGSALAVAAVAAGGILAAQTLSVNREFETLKASLITVTGSAEDATVAFKGIQDFASTTPFSVNELTQSFIKLGSLGLAPSKAALTSYGNTAGAMGKSLNQVIEAVADATTGEFERLKEFGIKARSEGDNVSFTFRGITRTVKKEAGEIEGYIRSLGDVEFAGGMERQAATINGAISNMGDSWDAFLDNLLDNEAEAMVARAFSHIGGAVDWLDQKINGTISLDSLINESTELNAQIENYLQNLKEGSKASIEGFTVDGVVDYQGAKARLDDLQVKIWGFGKESAKAFDLVAESLDQVGKASSQKSNNEITKLTAAGKVYQDYALRRINSDLDIMDSQTELTDHDRQWLDNHVDAMEEAEKADQRHFEEMKRQSDDWAKTFADNMVDAGGSFSNFADGVLKQMQKIAIQKATQPLFSAFSGFLDSSAFSSLLSFEGGGSTGGGSRSGGVDGKGGFPAIVHPNETVIDHTKGQSGSISVVVNVDASGSRTETNGGGADLGKAIGDAVKSILIQEKRAGGLLT